MLRLHLLKLFRGEDGCEPRGFVFERKGGEAAEQEAEDEEEEPEANGAEKLRSGFERGCHVWAIVAEASATIRVPRRRCGEASSLKQNHHGYWIFGNPPSSARHFE
jgi:hypothetical protein